ncbi:hypothetical protein I7I53_03627 [Histoplasma capsulatum var. duboisii H88]|uniref:Uncharacterized protein n=1 Tax=Ajellomyces capsulatus (strain H88) TaxID=544711 RepID=A0A8A1LN06_AJEC8|nr:hypothetical protein I7I53_03627 [Histoplasma capsulatum var. duboisii H88]
MTTHHPQSQGVFKVATARCSTVARCGARRCMRRKSDHNSRCHHFLAKSKEESGQDRYHHGLEPSFAVSKAQSSIGTRVIYLNHTFPALDRCNIYLIFHRASFGSWSISSCILCRWGIKPLDN